MSVHSTQACVTLARNVGEMRTETELLPQCWEQVRLIFICPSTLSFFYVQFVSFKEFILIFNYVEIRSITCMRSGGCLLLNRAES